MEKKIETTGIIGVILGLYKDNGKENGNYRYYRGYIGIMEIKMETTGIIGVL